MLYLSKTTKLNSFKLFYFAFLSSFSFVSYVIGYKRCYGEVVLLQIYLLYFKVKVCNKCIVVKNSFFV